MIEELLEAVLKSGQTSTRPAARGQRPVEGQPAESNPWLDLLEGFLKGSGANSPSTESNEGRSPEQSGSPLDLSRLLEIFLGGGRRGNVAANPMLAPFVEALAEKLGLSPQLAATIVSYAFSLLVSSVKDNPQAGVTASSFEQLLDANFLDRSGLSAQLAHDTGLAPEAARESLRTALTLLSGGVPASAPQPVEQPASGSSKLQHLLDEW